MKRISWRRLRSSEGESRSRVFVGLMFGLLAVAGTVFAVAAPAGASSASRFVQVQRAAQAPIDGTALGAPSASSAQSGFVVLKPRNNAALHSFIAGVTTPHSATYHQYLRAGQFRGQFGPAASTINTVSAQLRADGFKVGTVSSDGLMISFSGTTAQVESSFNTHLERYKTQAGVTGQLATSAVELPASIASGVAAVLGLDTLMHPEASLIRPPKSAYANYPAAKTAVIAHHPSGAPNPGIDTTDAACVAADGGSNPTEAAAQFGGLTDDQIANAYGAFGEYNAGDFGQGVHIAVYELEPFELSDLQTFDECYFGDAQAATMSGAGTSGTGNVTIDPVDGGQPAGPGSGESILDVEDVSAIAPGADVDVYEAPNTVAGGIDEYSQIVNNDTDQIVTSSWGFCEQDEELYEPGAQEAENYIFEQAAAQGQTVLNAAGDTGDDTCNEIRSVPPPADQNPLSLDDPASQPYVVSVGGTTLQDADPADFDETVWNDGANWGGGGGGISQSWAMPSWQADSLVPGIGAAEPGGADWDSANDVESNAASLGISDKNWPTGFCQGTVSGATSSTPCRVTPDVSAEADEFTGAITIYSASFASSFTPSGWITIGGTSSATPIWAAMLALVDESSGCSSIAPSTGGTGIGFATPLLYSLASDPTTYAASFHDITVGDNDVYGFDNGKVFPAHTGYSMAAGLGSPELTSPSGGAGLAADLCALVTSASARPAVSSLAPQAGPVAGGTPVTVTGTGFESGGTSDVSSVEVGGANVTGSAITVNSNTSLTLTMPTAAAAAAPPATTQSDPGGGSTVVGGSTQTQDGSGPAVVVVTTTAGTSSAPGPASTFAYVDENGSDATIPTVTSVGPYAGLESAPGEVNVYGSGFASGDTVTVGGVAATVDQVLSSYEMKVTPPAYSSANTDCVTASALTAETGDSDPASDDICQTQVEVDGPNGPSNTSTIYPTYEGTSLPTNEDGLPLVPQGFEVTPQPTEYDYVPAPTITSVSTEMGNPGSLASDGGGTVIQITGTGLDEQTQNWFDVGNPADAASIDAEEVYYTGTTVDLAVPATPDYDAGTPDTDAEVIPIYADTMGDQDDVQASASGNVVYAGIPQVTSITADATGNNPSGNVDAAYGLPVVPDTGGSAADTALTVGGTGFSDAVGPLFFVDTDSSFSESTQYGYSITSDSVISGSAPSSNPAIDDVVVCTVSGCSTPTSFSESTADELLFYPPGAPTISSLSVASGPAAGGQTVTITGENLGCPTSVQFGTAAALSITPTEALLDCGSTGSLTVVAPAGTAGQSVPVTLTTVETDATGDPAATSPTEFAYTADPSTSPSLLNFGTAGPGEQGSSETVTLSNPTGAAALNVGQVTLTGNDPGDFTITSDTCSAETLAAGATCTVTLQFTPSALGTRTAVLDIPFDQAANPIAEGLVGAGVEQTSTVTTPGKTVTTPGTTTTCTIVHGYRYKTVIVKVKVHGKIKREKKRKRVKYTTKVCKKSK